MKLLMALLAACALSPSLLADVVIYQGAVRLKETGNNRNIGLPAKLVLIVDPVTFASKRVYIYPTKKRVLVYDAQLIRTTTANSPTSGKTTFSFTLADGGSNVDQFIFAQGLNKTLQISTTEAEVLPKTMDFQETVVAKNAPAVVQHWRGVVGFQKVKTNTANGLGQSLNDVVAGLLADLGAKQYQQSAP